MTFGLSKRSTALAALTFLSLAAPAAGQTVRVPGIDSLHVRSVLQAQLNSTSVEDEPETEWLTRRARILIRLFAAGWIRGDLEYDMARGRPRLTDGFVRLDFDRRFRVRAGQFKKPFDTHQLVSSRELLVIERDGLPRGASLPTPDALIRSLGYSDRDIGAEWHGDFGAAALTAGFWNGSGANVAETDDGKQVAGRIDVEAGGWDLVAAWSSNRLDVIRRDVQGEEVDESCEAEWRSAFELAAGRGEYGEEGWKLLAQVFFGDGERFDRLRPSVIIDHLPVTPPPIEIDRSFTALHAIAAYHVALFHTPYVIGIEPVARFGWTDPDTDVDDDEAALWTAGVNLYHHERVKTQLQVDHVRPTEGDGETALRLQLGLGF